MRMATPEMKVVRFNENDIIVASGNALTMTLTGFGNSNGKDSNLNFDNKTYSVFDLSKGGGKLTNFRSDFNSYYGTNYTDNQSMFDIPFDSRTLNDVAGMGGAINDSKDTNSSLNGLYVWNGNSFSKQ